MDASGQMNDRCVISSGKVVHHDIDDVTLFRNKDSVT
jgi:hypothetical protein